jgi:NAD(P)H dehydrogenase (quinone)
MNILLILGHPDHKSFNHALALAVSNALRGDGHVVTFHDLYAERFDPVLPTLEIPDSANLSATIRNYCNELRAADGIVIVHPNWWGRPPALLAGWIDRVFRPGIAYRFNDSDSGQGVPVGLLRAKAAIVLNTSNTPAEREQKVFGDPLETLWRKCIFDLCGVHNFHRKMFGVIVTSTREQRTAWLKEAQELCRNVFK